MERRSGPGARSLVSPGLGVARRTPGRGQGGRRTQARIVNGVLMVDSAVFAAAVPIAAQKIVDAYVDGGKSLRVERCRRPVKGHLNEPTRRLPQSTSGHRHAPERVLVPARRRTGTLARNRLASLIEAVVVYDTIYLPPDVLQGIACPSVVTYSSIEERRLHGKAARRPLTWQ